MMYRDSVFKELKLKSQLIQERWLQLMLETYPKDTARFLEQEKDNFLNPVRSTISQAISAIYEELIGDMDTKKLNAALDRIIRIRAIQDFSPSQALMFIPLLKKAVSEIVINGSRENGDYHEPNSFEARLDKIVFLAFDNYMECREKVFNLRVKELAAQSENMHRILARINQEYE